MARRTPSCATDLRASCRVANVHDESSTQERPPFSPEYHKAAATPYVSILVLLPEVLWQWPSFNNVLTALEQFVLVHLRLRKVNHTHTRFNGAIVHNSPGNGEKDSGNRHVGDARTDDSLRQPVTAPLARSLYLVYLPSVKNPMASRPPHTHQEHTHSAPLPLANGTPARLGAVRISGLRIRGDN